MSIFNTLEDVFNFAIKKAETHDERHELVEMLSILKTNGTAGLHVRNSIIEYYDVGLVDEVMSQTLDISRHDLFSLDEKLDILHQAYLHFSKDGTPMYDAITNGLQDHILNLEHGLEHKNNEKSKEISNSQ